MSDNKEHDYGLTETTVEVINELGKKRVPALTHNSCPGLAVTMMPFGVFGVTSIPTGRRLANASERASSALLTMSQFAMIAKMKGKSWADMDQEQAAQLIKEAGPDEVPFDGATSTSSEGVKKLTVSEWFGCVRLPLPDEFPWEERDPFDLAIANLEAIE